MAYTNRELSSGKIDFENQYSYEDDIKSGLSEKYNLLDNSLKDLTKNGIDATVKFNSAADIPTPNWLQGYNLLMMFPEIAGPLNGLAKSIAGYKVYINSVHNPKIEQLLFNEYDMFNTRYKLALDYLSAGNPHVIAKYRDPENKTGLRLKVIPSHLTGKYQKLRDDVVSFEWYSPENGIMRGEKLRREWKNGEWVFKGYEWDSVKYPSSQWDDFGLSPLMILEGQFEIFSLFLKNIEKYYRQGSKTGTVYNFKPPENMGHKEFYKNTVFPFINSLRKQENLDGGFAHKAHAVVGLNDVFTDQRDITKFIDNETKMEYKKSVLNLYNIPLEKAGLATSNGGINSDKYQIMQIAYYEDAVKCHADAIDAMYNSFVVPRLIKDPAFIANLPDDITVEDLQTMRIENKKILTETESDKADRYFKAFELGIISKNKTQEEVFGFLEEEQDLDAENQIEDAIEEAVLDEITETDKVEVTEEIKTVPFKLNIAFGQSKTRRNYLINKCITKNYKRKKKINRLIKATDFSPLDELEETSQYENLVKNIKDALKRSYKSNLEEISELVLSKDTKKQVKTIVDENNTALGGFLKTEEIIEDLVFISEAAEKMARKCGEENENPDYNPDVANRVKSAREKIIQIRLANLNDDIDFVKSKDDDLQAEIKAVVESITQEGEGNITNLTAQLTALLLAFDEDKSLNTTTRKNLVKWIDRYIAEFPNATPAQLEKALDTKIEEVIDSRSDIIAQDTMVTIFGASAFVGLNVFAPRTKTWLRTRSAVKREEHLAQVGVEVDYNDVFPSGEFWSNTLPRCKCGITVKTKVFSDWGGISFRKPAVTIINS